MMIHELVVVTLKIDELHRLLYGGFSYGCSS